MGDAPSKAESVIVDAPPSIGVRRRRAGRVKPGGRTGSQIAACDGSRFYGFGGGVARSGLSSGHPDPVLFLPPPTWSIVCRCLRSFALFAAVPRR